MASCVRPQASYVPHRPPPIPRPSTPATMATAPATEISAGWYFFLFTLCGACIGLIWTVFAGDGEPLVASLGFAGLAFAATYCLITWLGEAFKRVGFVGRDRSKRDKREIPETMGAVCAVVYLMVMMVFVPFPFYEYLVKTSGGGNRDATVEMVETGRSLHRFPHNKLGEYLSALLSLQSMAILGVADDLFDIRWRHKLFLPAIAAVPMLIVYYVDFGVTEIVVPLRLQPLLGGGQLLNLSWGYYIYMAAIAIFCPNAINIYAGINGLEVAQSIVIAVFIALNDLLYISVGGHPATDSHLFSLYFLLPFLGVSGALWAHNRYPSRVFVGDTYCYFAGMTFAVVGILGHFSKTLLLLFVPQIFNFLYSAPQLFHLLPCPRHRMPHYNARTDLLEPSRAQFPYPPRWPVALALHTLHKLGLVQLWTAPDGTITECSNLTLLNLWLVRFGPMREDRLTYGLAALQVVACAAGLFVRHRLALLVFPYDNLKVTLPPDGGVF
ncbi:glycosyl transferase family 4-domain-containing protein [Geopyxis carbonaria]|nr:glycosyl transferase family 4-domain-containing protein [Geopyxis carbonaria]